MRSKWAQLSYVETGKGDRWGVRLEEVLGFLVLPRWDSLSNSTEDKGILLHLRVKALGSDITFENDLSGNKGEQQEKKSFLLASMCLQVASGKLPSLALKILEIFKSNPHKGL